MSEKIYYGEIDITDTRTNTVKRLKNVVYKPSNTITQISEKVIKKIPPDELKYYKITYHTDSAKVLGYSNI